MSPGGIKNVYTLWHERRWQERSSPALRVSSLFWPDATKGIMMTARAAQPHTKRKLVLPLQLPCTMSDSLCDQFRAYLLPHTVLFTRRQGGFSSLHSTCSWMYVCQRVIEDQWFSPIFLAADAIFRVQISPWFMFYTGLLPIYSSTSRVTL